jgi:hypothetical protein
VLDLKGSLWPQTQQRYFWTVVRGFAAVDTFNLASFSGDELTIIPYSYPVG